MTDHPEIEQLSAYLDGELTAAEAAPVEAHVPGCAECTRTLAAIRATLGDLALLTEPQLDSISITAIDSAVAAARASRRSFARRWGVVSGAAAAAVVALLVFVGVVRNDDGARTTSPVSLEAGTAGGAGAGTLDVSGIDYTEESLATALTALGPVPAQALSAPGAAVAPGAAGGGTTTGTDAPVVADSFAYSRGEARTLDGSQEQFARCVQQIERANPDTTAVRSEYARFKGRPAFVLFYTRPRENPTYAEVWVLRPADCYTLYFAQSRI